MSYSELCKQLSVEPRKWVVTGAAGFIGSHLCESLVSFGQEVVGVDDFSTGCVSNVKAVHRSAEGKGGSFIFKEGDINNTPLMTDLLNGADYILHQGALGSVPRSIEDPAASNKANVDGFISIVLAAREAGLKRIVYASSSSVYGDDPGQPKVENRMGNPLSPYAVTKKVNEIYASVFADLYNMEFVGLRYFNVFGARQNPAGAYAAVIPKWLSSALEGEQIVINGDGSISRDFCYINNVVQANILAAVSDLKKPCSAYNICAGETTSLTQLFDGIRSELMKLDPSFESLKAEYGPERLGDIKNSLGDMSAAMKDLGYKATDTVDSGLPETVRWYFENYRKS